MKKHFFALVVCLLLSVNAASADTSPALPYSLSPQLNPLMSPKSAPKGKSVIPSIPSAQTSKMYSQMKASEETRRNLIERRNKERQLMYAALNLTGDQITKAEAIDAKMKVDATNFNRRIRTEAKKLKMFEDKKAPFWTIHKQKQVIKGIKNEAKKYAASTQKSFEAILTREQKAKYKIIKKAKIQELKDMKKGVKHESYQSMQNSKKQEYLKTSTEIKAVPDENNSGTGK